MLPKLVHLFWIDPSGRGGELPPDIRVHIADWARLHPDFDVKVWSGQALRPICEDFHGLPLWQTMEACRFEAMKSDIARLALVYEYGGFYTDLKNKPLTPFLNDLLNVKEAVVTEHPPTVENFAGRVCNAFLGAEPKHEFFWACLRIVCEAVARRDGGGVIDVTGAGVLKKAIWERQDEHDYVILESLPVWGPKGGRGGWMRRTSASYNSPDMSAHWSVRQKTEGLYIIGFEER